MKNRRTVLLFLAAVVVLACSCPLAGVPGLSPSTEASPNPPISAPVNSPLPANSPAPVFTSTPSTPIAWPISQVINCRSGPGTEWDPPVGNLQLGQTATIQGRNADSTWWLVITPNNPGTPCWVAASVTNTAGNLALVPVVAAPPPPVAKVTGVTVKVNPTKISLPGCYGPVQPITVSGTITVSGAMKVKFYFDTEENGSLSSQSLNFTGPGTKSPEDSFSPTPGAGTFWVRLVVTSPNSISAEATYKIVCP